jgi:hypothetical protein
MPATRTGSRGRPLSDADLQQLMALLKGADSVELKLTVPDLEQRSTVAALGMDPLDARIRQIYFFDTPQLACYAAGVVVRGRRSQQRGDDSVVKLRPVVPAELPTRVRRSPNLSVEVDAMPGGYVCSASMKGTPDVGTVKEVAAGRQAIRRLFSKEQRAFFAAHAPADVGLDDLSPLGPFTALKLKFVPGEFGRRLVAELWFYPDGSRILELSTKCAPGEAFQVAAESRAYLSSRGVDLGAEQATKTKRALAFFSGGRSAVGSPA